MLTNERGGGARLVLVIAAAAVVGIPAFGYVWETLNQLLSGVVSGGRLVISIALTLLLAAVLYGAGRAFATLGVPEPAAEGAEEEPNVSGTLLITAFILIFIFGGWTVGYFLLMNR